MPDDRPRTVDRIVIAAVLLLNWYPVLSVYGQSRSGRAGDRSPSGERLPGLVTQLGPDFEAVPLLYHTAVSTSQPVFVTVGSPALLWDATTGGKIRSIGGGAMRL